MKALVQLRVQDPRALELVSGLIHDQYFEADAIEFDEPGHRVTIPFEYELHWGERVIRRRGRRTLTEKPLFRGVLDFREVLTLRVTDNSQVGTYDFNQLKFDPDNHLLTVETNIPIDIVLRVEAIDVSVSIRDEHVGFRRVRHTAWGGIDVQRTVLDGLSRRYVIARKR